MNRFLIATMLLCLTAGAGAAPKQRHVTLQKFTTITVDIVPDLGTRFVFPFVLDEQDEYVPFTLNITNPAFVSRRDPGRNSFVLTAPSQGGGAIHNYVGNMFVTVAGYEISVELRTTSNLGNHYSDVIFDIGDAEREDLIQKGIAQRTKVLEQQYKQKLAEVDKLADQRAAARIGALALKEPTHRRIKEETRVDLKNGDRAYLYVDEGLTFGPYTVVSFEITNDSDTQGLTLIDAKLFAIDAKTKAERPIDAAHEIPPRVLPGEKGRGTITVVDGNLNKKEMLKLQVLTDKASIEAKW